MFGGCQLPIAAQAIIVGDQVELVGLIAKEDGSEVIKSDRKGNIADSDHIGTALAETLLGRGGDKILKELMQ